jgi:hypothetical protein
VKYRAVKFKQKLKVFPQELRDGSQILFAKNNNSRSNLFNRMKDLKPLTHRTSFNPIHLVTFKNEKSVFLSEKHNYENSLIFHKKTKKVLMKGSFLSKYAFKEPRDLEKVHNEPEIDLKNPKKIVDLSSQIVHFTLCYTNNKLREGYIHPETTVYIPPAQTKIYSFAFNFTLRKVQKITAKIPYTNLSNNFGALTKTFQNGILFISKFFKIQFESSGNVKAGPYLMRNCDEVKIGDFSLSERFRYGENDGNKLGQVHSHELNLMVWSRVKKNGFLRILYNDFGFMEIETCQSHLMRRWTGEEADLYDSCFWFREKNTNKIVKVKVEKGMKIYISKEYRKLYLLENKEEEEGSLKEFRILEIRFSELKNWLKKLN